MVGLYSHVMTRQKHHVVRQLSLPYEATNAIPEVAQKAKMLTASNMLEG